VVGIHCRNGTACTGLYGRGGVLNDKLRDICLRIFGAPADPSDNGNQQIIIDLLNNLVTENDYVLDIGASNGIEASNTYHLFKAGSPGLLVEPDGKKIAILAREYKEFNVSIFRCKATPTTVVPILKAARAPKNPMFLSFDIDTYDYYVLYALLEQYRPTLICAEINEKIPYPVRFAVKYSPDHCYAGNHFFGMSIATLGDLGKDFGYDLIHVNYNNAFLIPHECNQNGGWMTDVQEHYLAGYVNKPDRKQRFPRNADLDLLLEMEDPEQIVHYLKHYFAKYHGQYIIGV
jgi:hypothetical protein